MDFRFPGIDHILTSAMVGLIPFWQSSQHNTIPHKGIKIARARLFKLYYRIKLVSHLEDKLAIFLAFKCVFGVTIYYPQIRHWSWLAVMNDRDGDILYNGDFLISVTCLLLRRRLRGLR